MKIIFLFLVGVLIISPTYAGRYKKKYKTKKPVAKLKISKNKCKSPCTVILDGSKSKPVKGKTISKYIFDLGNGETIESATPTIEFTYINFKEETDKKKRKKRLAKYKKWKKYLKYYKNKFKSFDKLKISLQIVQSDNKTSLNDKKLLFVKASDSMPVIDGDDIIPPVPDQALSDSTLEGIDVDGDGVRDDVELFINDFYKDSSNLRKATKYFAKAIFKELTLIDSKESLIASTIEKLSTQRCLDYIEINSDMSFSVAIENLQQLNLSIYNTLERAKAKIKVSENFHGQQILMTKANATDCNFELTN